MHQHMRLYSVRCFSALHPPTQLPILMPTRTSPCPHPHPSTTNPQPRHERDYVCMYVFIIIRFCIQCCPSPTVSGFWLTRGNAFRKRYVRVATRSSNLALATTMDMLGFTLVDVYVCMYVNMNVFLDYICISFSYVVKDCH